MKDRHMVYNEDIVKQENIRCEKCNDYAYATYIEFGITGEYDLCKKCLDKVYENKI